MSWEDESSLEGQNSPYNLKNGPKTPFLVVFATFLKKGWLGIVENCIKCRVLRARSPRALGIDASFQ